MLILALESSAKTASAALFEDERFLGQYFQAEGLTHSRTLLPMAEALIKNTDHTIKDLGLIAVSHGPGSFTGLRIGMAAAKGLAWGLEIPAVGVSTLEAMAFGGIDKEGALLCCAMDARRNQVYNALFEIRDGKPCRLCEDRAIAIADLEAELLQRSRENSSNSECLLLGDGAELCYNTLDKEKLSVRLVPEPLRFQCARGVALAARGKTPGSAQDLLPVYLRLSQAERERQARLNKEAE